MTQEKKLTVTASPHIKSSATTTKIMLDVILALTPALIASVCIFGWRALLLTAVTVGVCVVSEFLSRKVMKRPNTIGDLSAVVTGMLLAFNLPVNLPLWMAALGGVAAIVVVKQMFGGIGQNFVNPALIGRIILLASFPTQMATWTAPVKFDAVTTATPLAQIAAGETQDLPSLTQMLLGLRGGCLGEVCAVAILLGGIYLIARKVISPIIPCTYIGTVAVLMLIAGKGDFTFLAYELMGGGLLLGAFFMATDYATSPMHTKGKIIFGVGCGLVTVLIRLFGSLPEGVSFSIILMNILTPHIDRLTMPKPFGWQKPKKEGKQA